MPKTRHQPVPATQTPIESASRDELEAIQTARCKKILHHAYYNVESYKQKFDKHGVVPNDFKELSDLARFPTTEKEDLRAAYPFGMLAVEREKLVRIHASSGTTGQPTVVGYTQADLDLWAEMIQRSLFAAGARSGDILHNAYGYGLFTGGLGLHDGAERMGMSVVPVSGGMTQRQVQLINDFKPQVITATPSYMLAIADEFDSQGVDTRSVSLEVGIHGAEPWTEAMREEIEERFNMHAVNIYGLSEILGPGVASECVDAKDGLVVWEDHFYPEIVDPESGKTLPDGEMGELLFTTLTKEALPIIRYRTRDLTRLLSPSSRNMRRIDRIMGRTDDMMIIRGVNVFPTQIEQQILMVANLAPHYMIEIERDSALDEIRVLVEERQESDQHNQMKLASDLADRIKQNIGITADVRVLKPASVDRSAGKAIRVRDLR